MKTLADNKTVTSRSYYFLLDWNEHNDWEYIREHFDKQKLSSLTIYEYRELWLYASSSEYDNILTQKP